MGQEIYLSDPWTGFTQFTLLNEKAPNGYMWFGDFGPAVPKNPGVLLPDFSCAYPGVDRRWMFLVLAGWRPTFHGVFSVMYTRLFSSQ